MLFVSLCALLCISTMKGAVSNSGEKRWLNVEPHSQVVKLRYPRLSLFEDQGITFNQINPKLAQIQPTRIEWAVTQIWARFSLFGSLLTDLWPCYGPLVAADRPSAIIPCGMWAGWCGPDLGCNNFAVWDYTSVWPLHLCNECSPIQQPCFNI